MTDVMAQTPPVLEGPTEKERKYDRQLRLWAANGQAALESANILLVNSGTGTVGVETLKNLVLPGIGKFTIADTAVVAEDDLGVNFFLDESCLGQSRAKCCAKLLTELNPEVGGEWHPKNGDELDLNSILDGESPFTMILYALPLPVEQLQRLQAYGRQKAVPLLAVHSAGFYSYFTTTLPDVLPIVETHPDEAATADLRLLTPWPELSAFAKEMTTNIDGLNDHDHGHLPMVVILLHFLEVWKRDHDGALPLKYADKIAFRDGISKATRRANAEGSEENFDEAVAAVMKHLVMPALPSSLKQVFEYQHSVSKTDESSFWVIARAVEQFHEKYRALPVAGGLPDMKAQSEVYIRLQNIYKSKARRDAEEVLAIAHSLPGGEDVDATKVELFCANARFIKLIDSSAGTGKAQLADIAAQELENDKTAALVGPEMPLSLLPIYLALCATSHATESAVLHQEILEYVKKIAPAAAENERMKWTAQEVSRAGGAELHNISAVVGGLVAQEMIKIITKQYVPIDNTCIYDGITSRCQVLRL